MNCASDSAVCKELDANWTFKYNPYPSDKAWNEERLEYVRELVPNGLTTVRSLYERFITAPDESDARRQAIEYIYSQRPARYPKHDEVVNYLTQLTHEEWSYDSKTLTYSSPNVFGIYVRYANNTDTLWTFLCRFDKVLSPQESPTLNLSNLTDSQSLAQLLVSDLIPKYLKTKSDIETREALYNERATAASKEFVSIMSPLTPTYDEFNSECDFELGEIRGHAVVFPEKVIFETMAVPYELARKIVGVLKENIDGNNMD